MRKLSIAWMVLAISAIPLVTPMRTASAFEPGSGLHLLTGWLNKSSVNVHPYTCDRCGEEHDSECIERVPVTECKTGKKKVYDSSIRYEYVSIPEVRHRWKMKCITKEIPAEGCKPVCDTKECQQCYGVERWTKESLGCSCGKLHCKHVDSKTEKTRTKCTHCEPSETTVKVKVWTCVKVPYTVYRQVKRPVCVKQPRYEKVEIPVTRYVCNKQKRCDKGCADCSH